MRIAMIVVGLMLATSSLAHGEDTVVKRSGTMFYKQKINEYWTVFGNTYPNSKHHTKCVASRGWRDGSDFQLTKDLDDNELYIWWQNYAWDIRDKVREKYTLRVNAYKDNQFVDGGDLEFILVNKNVIYTQALNQKNFFKAFIDSDRLMFSPPGTTANAHLHTEGKAQAIVDALSECEKAASQGAKLSGLPSRSAKKDDGSI